MYKHLTWEECLQRYPALVRAMQWQACLSSSEAACGIRDYRDARTALQGINPYIPSNIPFSPEDSRKWGEEMMRFGGGEAVQHGGGPRKVIALAIKNRHAARAASGGKLIK